MGVANVEIKKKRRSPLVKRMYQQQRNGKYQREAQQTQVSNQSRFEALRYQKDALYKRGSTIPMNGEVVSADKPFEGMQPL